MSNGNGEDQQQVCGVCQGQGVTTHIRYTQETNEKGEQVPVTQTWMGPCGSCTGSGK